MPPPSWADQQVARACPASSPTTATPSAPCQLLTLAPRDRAPCGTRVPSSAWRRLPSAPASTGCPCPVLAEGMPQVGASSHPPLARSHLTAVGRPALSREWPVAPDAAPIAGPSPALLLSPPALPPDLPSGQPPRIVAPGNSAWPTISVKARMPATRPSARRSSPPMLLTRCLERQASSTCRRPNVLLHSTPPPAPKRSHPRRRCGLQTIKCSNASPNRAGMLAQRCPRRPGCPFSWARSIKMSRCPLAPRPSTSAPEGLAIRPRRLRGL
mmetsp:Transcript_43130/g.137739  ORF Transcript_43130/g.137739 Transcript_43130/m.137739 type:complete len:270 (-) Transcript_43130:52-861(-)